MTHRIVYMGTPEFACPALKTLARRDDVDVNLVVTQPDRASGRGRKLQAPPVKVLAESLGLRVYQTPSLRAPEQRQPIVDARPDLIVVAAFGLILGKSVLGLPRLGCVNLHASLLPHYRGASPISAAIATGDTESGVTLMRMERGLDTGPMLAIARTPILPADSTATLTDRLAKLAASLLDANLDSLLAGALPSTPQPDGATLARPLVKADGWLDWSRPAKELERHVRAMWPWPRAWTSLPDGRALQVHAANLDPAAGPALPGTVVTDVTGFRVACGEGWLRVDVAQLPGGKPLSGAQLARGAGIVDGLVLGQGEPPATPGPMVAPGDS